jgi:site-specific recombinase XerD
MRLTKIKQFVPSSLGEALEHFLLWKKAQGLSEQTLEDYTNHVKLFLKRYPDVKDSYENLERDVFLHLGQDNIKPATYNNRLVYLRTFFNWCVDKDIISENPLSGFKKRKAEGRIVNIEESTLIALIQLPNRNTYAGLRDYALFLLFLDCGIRPKEAFTLTEEDFNKLASEVRIEASKAKTRMSRTLHLMPKTVTAIEELLSIRPKEWKGKAPIFCTNEGKQMNRHTWGDRVESYCKKLGTKFHPYALRHAFALIFLRSKGNAFALQNILGHVDMSMTKRYVRLTNTDLKEQHAEASPLNRLLPEKKRLAKLPLSMSERK